MQQLKEKLHDKLDYSGKDGVGKYEEKNKGNIGNKLDLSKRFIRVPSLNTKHKYKSAFIFP